MKTSAKVNLQTPEWRSADRPIPGRAQDKLGRSGFAEAIATAIRGWEAKDSLVIALYGPGGTGKSSIKNMIIEATQGMADPSPVTEFNPWQFANREQMTAAFFDQIGIILNRETRISRLWRWQKYGTYLTVSRNLIELLRKLLLWVFSVCGLSLLGAAALNESTLLTIPGFSCLALAAALGLFADGAETILTYLRLGVDRGRASVGELKQDLARSFQQLRHPILIVMDDLDCLTPLEMQEVLQLVKANADFPNFVYLLLFDRTVVEGNINRVLGVPGNEYIDKIVQVGFELPAVEQPRLNSVFFDGLNRLLSEQSVAQHFHHQRWANLFSTGLQPYLQNLRQVNRFHSNLATHIALFQGKEILEVNVVDLIGLEVLRVFEPAIYRALASNKEVLTRTGLWETASHEEKARSVLLGIVDSATAEKKAAVGAIVRQLFPPAEWVFGGARCGAEREEEWYLEFRACASDLFDRYFHFAIPESSIPQETIEGLLAAVADRGRLRTELRTLNSRGLLESALEWLEECTDTGEMDRTPLVTALFDIGDELPDTADGLFEITPAMGAIRMIDRLLWRQKNSDRSLATLRAAIEHSVGISLPIGYLNVIDRESRIGSKDMAELKQLCVRKIRFAAASGGLTKKSGFRMILCAWKEWGNSQEAVDFCKELVRTEAGASSFVGAFLWQYRSQMLGRRGTRERWYVKLSEIEQFAPCDLIEKSFRGVPAENLPASEQLPIRAFRQALDRRSEGRADLAPILAFPTDRGGNIVLTCPRGSYQS